MDASTAGIVAIGAGAVALVALGVAGRALLALRRLRRDQTAVLGDDRRDLVAHAAGLQEAFVDLHGYVDEVARRLDERLGRAEERLDGAISHAGLVRYDAYNEMSGRQSTSLALLDARRDGLVLSSIHHRDQARLYAKRVLGGQGELELSPEEAEAIRQALGG